MFWVEILNLDQQDPADVLVNLSGREGNSDVLSHSSLDFTISWEGLEIACIRILRVVRIDDLQGVFHLDQRGVLELETVGS